MATIINPWKSPHYGSHTDYTVGNAVYQYGDYAIYHLFGKNYLYVYKNMAFNELAGLNRDHLIRVADRKRPPDYDGDTFLYDRAIETLASYIH